MQEKHSNPRGSKSDCTVHLVHKKVNQRFILL